jgi:hypothetical protein
MSDNYKDQLKSTEDLKDTSKKEQINENNDSILLPINKDFENIIWAYKKTTIGNPSTKDSKSIDKIFDGHRGKRR